jgi:hypothetical protein
MHQGMPILVVTVMAATSMTTAVMVLNAKPMTRSPGEQLAAFLGRSSSDALWPKPGLALSLS